MDEEGTLWQEYEERAVVAVVMTTPLNKLVQGRSVLTVRRITSVL